MADDTNTPSEENLKLAADLKLLKEYKDLTAAAAADWKKISEGVANSEERVNALLDTQAEYATANDKHLAFLEEIKRIELEKLANEKESLLQLEKQLSLKLQEMAAAPRKRKDQREQLKNAKKVTDQLTKRIENQKKNLKVSEAAIRARDKEIAQKQKIQKLEENAEKLTDNALQQSTGMITSAGSLGELIAKNAAEGKGFGDIMEGVSKSFGKTFTKANLLMTVVGKLREMGESFKSTFIGIDTEFMDFAQTARIFTRETGAAAKFGKELRSLKSEFHDLNFLHAETAQAYQGMLEHSTAFMHHSMGADQRKELALQAATLERFNVSTSVFGETVDSLNKTFGESPAQIKRTTSDLTKFARALGVGPDKMLNQFNQNLNLMAQYGRDKGVKVFKELSVAAQHAGVKLESLVSIAKTFDTFEGAAEAAGKLNFILGGPLINSIDMINQSENERIQTLKDSLRVSGKTFAAMGRYEKQLIAQVLQTDIATAQKLFSSDDINNIEAATRAVQDNANGARNLAAEADDLRTVKERDRLATEAQIEAMKGLADTFLWLNEQLSNFKKFMAPVLVGLGALSMIFGAALPYAIGLFGAKILSVLGVGGALSTGIGGIVAKLGVLKTALTTLGAGGILGKLTAVGTAIKGSALAMAAGTTALVGAAAATGGLIGHKLNEMTYGEGNVDYGSMSDLKSIRRYIGFADGVTGFKGGAAVVGEKGPELLNLPRGSNVLTNENLNRLMLSLEKQATLGTAPQSKIGLDRLMLSLEKQATLGTATQSKIGTTAPNAAGPELVTLRQGSNVVTNENLNRLILALEKQATSDTAPTQRPSPSSTGEVKQPLNITLELDGDVLAKATRAISFDTITQALSLVPGQ